MITLLIPVEGSLSPHRVKNILRDHTHLTDSEILTGISARSDQAFQAIYHDRTIQLKNYITNNNGSPADAQDIEQKTIIVLYEKVISGHFSLTSKLSTFLFSVGRNLWLKELRKKSLTNSLADDAYNDYEDINFTMEAEDDQEERLLSCLQQLGVACQRLLRGKYYDKMSDKDLSEALGDISEENVRKRRYKCIQKLKKFFLKEKTHG